MNLNNEWREPVVIENSVTAFPVNSVPHYLADFFRALALEVQVPFELPFIAGLSVLAAATRGKIEVLVRGRHVEQLSFYNITALGSGNRKSEIVKTLRAPLSDIEKTLIAETSAKRERQLREKNDYEQELKVLEAKAKKSAGGSLSLLADIEATRLKIEKCEVLPEFQLFADNTTPEKHAVIIAEQGSVAIIEPEGGFFEGLSRYSTSKVPQVDYLNKTYGGEPFRVDRQGSKSVYAERPHAVLHFSLQPHIVAAIRNNHDFMNTGFANRFLFFMPQSLIGQRSFEAPQVSQALLQSWQMIVRGIFFNCHEKAQRQLLIEPEGLQLLRIFSENLEPKLITSLLQIQGWASKLQGQLIRIAALYELAANPTAQSISTENLKAAIELAPYLQEHALKALVTPTKERPAHKVLFYLIEKANELQGHESGSVGNVGAFSGIYEFTTRSIHRQFNKSAWLAHSDNQALTVRGVLLELQQNNWIRQIESEPNQKGGRPAEKWELHPQAGEFFKTLFD